MHIFFPLSTRLEGVMKVLMTIVVEYFLNSKKIKNSLEYINDVQETNGIIPGFDDFNDSEISHLMWDSGPLYNEHDE